MIHWRNVKRKGNTFQLAIKPAMLLPEGYTLTTHINKETVDILYDADYVKEKIEATIKPLNCALTKDMVMSLLTEVVEWIFPSGDNIKAKEKSGVITSDKYSRDDTAYGEPDEPPIEVEVNESGAVTSGMISVKIAVSLSQNVR